AAVAGAAVGMDRPAHAGPAPRWWSSLVWGVFENRTFTEVSALASHRRLAREGAVLSRYFAVSHPSGPNYRAMASGETWGTDEVVDAFHPTVASAGAAAARAVPAYVYHLAGTIAPKHNPLVDLHAPIARTRNGFAALRAGLSGGPEGLPDRCLVYVGWDDDNDMHNGHPLRADANLGALLDALAGSAWFRTPDAHGRYPAFFFCYDEDDFKSDNRVFAVFWGRGVRRGAGSAVRHTHYGFCRTMTDNWDLPALGRAAGEAPITEIWL
ncbi:MAG TPA: hypothetical protein VJT33_16575, partial [bacterium]|nr:hypothetical protein [bacterium]